MHCAWEYCRPGLVLPCPGQGLAGTRRQPFWALADGGITQYIAAVCGVDEKICLLQAQRVSCLLGCSSTTFVSAFFPADQILVGIGVVKGVSLMLVFSYEAFKSSSIEDSVPAFLRGVSSLISA